jgi:hypothetical protein
MRTHARSPTHARRARADVWRRATISGSFPMQIEPMWESTAQGGHIEAHIGAEVRLP